MAVTAKIQGVRLTTYILAISGSLCECLLAMILGGQCFRFG
jgi:hypothetical protein